MEVAFQSYVAKGNCAAGVILSIIISRNPPFTLLQDQTWKYIDYLSQRRIQMKKN
jgi:hypothetical protein